MIRLHSYSLIINDNTELYFSAHTEVNPLFYLTELVHTDFLYISVGYLQVSKHLIYEMSYSNHNIFGCSTPDQLLTVIAACK
jgi:hypothetical protein